MTGRKGEGMPNLAVLQISSDSLKKNAISLTAFSGESLPWTALRSMSVP